MKRNNKGFTLVELLAALVILGVLAVFALPTVVNLMGTSRNKLYISDAKKLISQAEYKFRAASSELEKPDDGECLVLSMVYLDNSDFDDAPNDGRYVREASYVVIKNNNGNYEFSVELVEEIDKNSYKGVSLIRDSQLRTSSIKPVVSFKKEELHFVENNTTMGSYNGKYLDTSYINSKLGSSYVGVISKVYNYPDLADSTYSSNFAIPKITRVEYISASNKGFKSLDTILKIVVADGDTTGDDLLVYVGPGSDGRYPDLNVDFCNAAEPYNFTACKYSYGNLSDFSLAVDFSKIGLDYNGETTSLYVMVVDPEGNSDRLNPTYKIHTNEPPEIDIENSKIKRRSDSNINSSDAVLHLVVLDDITPLGDLEYCITEDLTAESCPTEYHKYSDFNNSDLEFKFTCGGTCEYKGDKVKLRVFLRDNSPEKLGTFHDFEYELYENLKPEITKLKLKSEDLAFLKDGESALTAVVELDVDDKSDAKNIKVLLAEDAGFSVNRVEKDYSDFKNIVKYTFSGNYDGSEKKLHVRVTDEFGSFEEKTVTYGKIHDNEKPIIDNVSITSKDILTYVCPNTGLCDNYPNNGGAYEVDVNVTATDDLVYRDDLLVCISDTQGDCTDISKGNFKPYSDGHVKSLTFTNTEEIKKFNGQTKNVYVAVYDAYATDGGNYSFAEYTGEKTYTYNIYKNKPPVIDDRDIIIKSKDDNYNFKDVTVSFKVQDDLDLVNNLKYALKEKESDTAELKNVTATSFEKFTTAEFSFSGNYDGGIRDLILEVYDTYGEKTSYPLTYVMHENEAPQVNYVVVESAEENFPGNSLITKVKVHISDDLDTNFDDFGICLSTVEGSCTNFVLLKDYEDVEKNGNDEYVLPYEIKIDNDLPYNGDTITVYAYVKDKLGKVGKSSGDYTLYQNNKAIINGLYPKVISTNADGLNSSRFKFILKATDEFNSDLKYNVCYTTKADTPVDSPVDGVNVKCFNSQGLYDYVADPVTKEVTIELDFGVSFYEGTEYYLFAKVYDDYAQACYEDSSKCGTRVVIPEEGEEVSGDLPVVKEDYIAYSSMYPYKLYKDVAPTINKFTVNRPSGTTSYSKLDVVFNVKDSLDNYKYCISEDGLFPEEEKALFPNEEEVDKSAEVLQNIYRTKCTNYSSINYDGNNTEDVTLSFTTNWTTLDDNRDYILFLYIKDSHGNIATTFAVPDRVPCSAIGENVETPTDENGGLDNGMVRVIEYELKPGNVELTAEKCGYKCYYWEEDESANIEASHASDIKSYYKKTIKFVDKDDNSIICSNEGNSVDENFEVHCNFRTCYKDASGGYNVTAIGYTKYENNDTVPFSHIHNGETHIPEYYRKEYTTDYNERYDFILLNPTENKICGKCYDEGLYNNVIMTYDNVH